MGPLRMRRVRLAVVSLAACAALMVPLLVASSSPARVVKVVKVTVKCSANYARSTTCFGTWSIGGGFSDHGSFRTVLNSPFSGFSLALKGSKGKIQGNGTVYPNAGKKGCDIGGNASFNGTGGRYKNFRASSVNLTCGNVSAGRRFTMSLVFQFTFVKP